MKYNTYVYVWMWDYFVIICELPVTQSNWNSGIVKWELLGEMRGVRESFL